MRLEEFELSDHALRALVRAGQGGGHHTQAPLQFGLVRRQAYMLAFSDTIILQSVLLGLALVSVLLLKKAKAGSAGEAH